MSEVNLRRLKFLFEHCCSSTMHAAKNFKKDKAGVYVDSETEDLFSLWLAGHAQGVADQANADGSVQQ